MNPTCRFTLGLLLLCLGVQGQGEAPPADKAKVVRFVGLGQLMPLPEVSDMYLADKPDVDKYNTEPSVVKRKNYPGVQFQQRAEKPSFLDRALDKGMDVPGIAFDKAVPLVEGFMAAWNKLRGGGDAAEGAERKSLLPSNIDKKFAVKYKVVKEVLADLETYLKSDTTDRIVCGRVKETERHNE